MSLAIPRSAAPETVEPDEPNVVLLEADPDLARYVASSDLQRARQALEAPGVMLDPGEFDPADVLQCGTNPFAALIVSGLVAREVCVFGQPTLRLLGPGDVIHAGVPDGELVLPEQSWSAAVPTLIAILDDRLLHCVRRWPRLLRGLMERVNQNHDATLLQLAIAQQPRVEDRLVALFGLLAEKWGRMTSDGVLVGLVLTHEALGRLIGARRPTVTLALKSLAEQGRLTRQPDGTWLVTDLATLSARGPLLPLTDGNRPRPVSTG